MPVIGRMPNSVFECPTPKCAYAIDTEGLNKIQLKALRMWVKTCPRCKQTSHWVEKLALLDTKTISKANGGQNESLNTTLPKTQSQKRKAARYTGH